MKLNCLALQNFRNHKHLKIDFQDEKCVIVGKNTSGKSNLLEAICVLAFGKSRYAEREEELVTFDECHASVMGEKRDGDKKTLQVIYFQNPQTLRLQKKYLINNLAKTATDFCGNLYVVSFFPDDLKIVAETPGLRRSFMNACLLQVDKKYKEALNLYEKSIRSRNAILERIKNGLAKRQELEFWNHVSIQNGNYLTKKREEFINFIVGAGLSTRSPRGRVKDSPLRLNIVYDRSEISEERLAKYESAEIASTSTLVGPHRDDLQFFDGERNLKTFGSRGEQRLTLLLLKLQELRYIEEQTHEKPVLLLDDIFSELDDVNRQLVLDLIADHQTIITTADEKDLEILNLGESQRVYL